jgi:hypothetical protein
MAVNDPYSRWLWQDVPRLLLTIITVAIVVWGLWLAELRWQILTWVAEQVPSGAGLDTPAAPVGLEDNDQKLEGE